MTDKNTTTQQHMPVWISDSEIDPAWICAKIPEFKAAGVRHCQVVDISNATRKGERPRDGATLLLTLTFENDENSKTLVVKQVPSSGLAMSKQLGLAREAFFYNDLAPQVKVGEASSLSSSIAPCIPKIYYAYGNMEEGSKVVIMEYLSDDGYIDSGILFGPCNPNNWNRNLPEMIGMAYPSPATTAPPTGFEVASETFLAIAEVHATFWKDNKLLEPRKSAYLRGGAWIQGEQEASWEGSQGMIQGIWERLKTNQQLDDRIQWDPLVKKTVEKAMTGISWEAQKRRLNMTNSHWTLVHGDFWPGNVMISTTNTKDLRLLDWEMCGLGSGPQDLGQYVLSNMDPDERRACEDKLVHTYYDELIRMGLKDFTWEECWREYTIGGIERWLWFLVYFAGNDNLLDWCQLFHNQVKEFMYDHNITSEDVIQPRP